jgi:hypothetical protein
LAALVLASCNYNRTPNFAAEAPSFKVPADYRQKIIAWTQRYYVEPESVRLLGVTYPMPVLTTNGVPVWLVCAELDARERGGPYMGPRRIAFGLHPEFSAPMERRKIDLQNEDCEKPQLTWREWPNEVHGARTPRRVRV